MRRLHNLLVVAVAFLLSVIATSATCQIDMEGYLFLPNGSQVPLGSGFNVLVTYESGGNTLTASSTTDHTSTPVPGYSGKYSILPISECGVLNTVTLSGWTRDYYGERNITVSATAELSGFNLTLTQNRTGLRTVDYNIKLYDTSRLNGGLTAGGKNVTLSSNIIRRAHTPTVNVSAGFLSAVGDINYPRVLSSTSNISAVTSTGYHDVSYEVSVAELNPEVLTLHYLNGGGVWLNKTVNLSNGTNTIVVNLSVVDGTYYQWWWRMNDTYNHTTTTGNFAYNWTIGTVGTTIGGGTGGGGGTPPPVTTPPPVYNIQCPAGFYFNGSACITNQTLGPIEELRVGPTFINPVVIGAKYFFKDVANFSIRIKSNSPLVSCTVKASSVPTTCRVLRENNLTNSAEVTFWTSQPKSLYSTETATVEFVDVLNRRAYKDISLSMINPAVSFRFMDLTTGQLPPTAKLIFAEQGGQTQGVRIIPVGGTILAVLLGVLKKKGLLHF